MRMYGFIENKILILDKCLQRKVIYPCKFLSNRFLDAIFQLLKYSQYSDY